MSKFGGDNKTFKAVQFLLNTKEAARRESNYDVRDLEYSDKLRNISVSGDIDFERAREYFLTIQARDGGSPPLSNHATVNVTIMDTNDNSPIFTQLSYSAAVNENSPIGANIVTLTATDLDQVRVLSPFELFPVYSIFSGFCSIIHP